MPAIKESIYICALQLFSAINKTYPDFRKRLMVEFGSDGCPIVFIRAADHSEGLRRLINEPFFRRFSMRFESWILVRRIFGGQIWDESADWCEAELKNTIHDIGWRYRESMFISETDDRSDEEKPDQTVLVNAVSSSVSSNEPSEERPNFLRKIMD